MRVLVIGGGGREHAVIKALSRNKGIDEICALPGNGGMDEAVCVPIGAVEKDKIVDFAVKNGIDYAVVTPDDPLALGVTDALQAAGIRCFGPTRAAAQIESSKAFAKALMKKYGIPTASCEIFDDEKKAIEYLARCSYPVVVKADGLALGKGVVIAKDRARAESAVHSMMSDKIFGTSGDKVLIEEYLSGPEVSVLSFTDGKTVKPMVSSMDHKRAFDGDEGPNTGGMGAVAPNPYYTPEIADRCMREIFLPTIKAMEKEGRRFKGCLYFGLMLTENGPKVIEYNCRFGDPETQAVLPLMESDLFTVMQAVTDEKLAETEVKFSDKHSCCVVMASAGYPLKYEKGFEITVPPQLKQYVFAAGAARKEDKLLTNGGRVLGVSAVADSLEEAVSKAYDRVKQIRFENAFYRRDIGKRALEATEGK